MRYIWRIVLSILIPYTCLHAEEDSFQQIKLQNCLMETWGVDVRTTAYLCHYFKPFLENENFHHLIDDFVTESIKLDIQFPIDKKLICLPPDDGVIQATQFHLVVFESPYVRILAGRANPQEKEPLHSHIWKSLLVVFSDASYHIEYANGLTEFLNIDPGIYELLPESPYACTNIGPTQENCLRFEVKD